MNKLVKITIDGKECIVEKGIYIVVAAKNNGIFIPTLCNLEGVKPKGSCRICTVKVNGRLMTACTTPVNDGMKIENNIPELHDLRKAIVEALFVEGNHYCPVCEKSGNCELQALAYRFNMMVPRFPYQFDIKEVDASHPKIIKDDNRCILCKRCVRTIKTDDGKSIFAVENRSNKTKINIDSELTDKLTDKLAKKAMDVCPVGSILYREKGYDVPIGKRKYDLKPIGSDIEN
ncbi:MAG: 2Fe-2S iron-sulfur cluster-binding protein [Bacteroidota bacterium]|nr:2Fe-2S iron-sulfur cluster-binding protein [Bacteroidota bacterium]